MISSILLNCICSNGELWDSSNFLITYLKPNT